MLKKFAGTGLGEKARSDSPSDIASNAKKITERVMQKICFAETKKGIGTDFSELVI